MYTHQNIYLKFSLTVYLQINLNKSIIIIVEVILYNFKFILLKFFLFYIQKIIEFKRKINTLLMDHKNKKIIIIICKA